MSVLAFNPAEQPQGHNTEPMQSDDDLAKMVDDQWAEARRWWAPVHAKARKARDYYHMLQWSTKQAETLRQLGRPAIVINLIGKAVDNVCGRERASRYDWKAAPIGLAEVMVGAAMTHALKGVARQTDTKYRVSEAFENAVLGPMGWGEVGYDDSDPDQPPEVVDAPDPMEMFFDPHSRRLDLLDAKYVIRRRIVDLEDAIDVAPHKEQELRAAATYKPVDDTDEADEVIDGDYDNVEQPDTHWGSTHPGLTEEREGRPRVSLREHQYWKREKVRWLEMPDGRRFFEEDLDHASWYAIQARGGREMEGRRKVFYQTIVCSQPGAARASIVLYRGRMSIPLGRFTYAALFAKRDRKGRPYGLVERAIPCQEEVNVARSKLNEAIRSRWMIYNRGALGNTSETEAATRLGQASFAFEVDSTAGVLMGSDRADIEAWLKMMETAKAEIDAVFGNNDAAYGDKSQEISGIAQKVRIQQQAQNLGGIFDNLRYFRKTLGEMLLVVLQKHTTPEKLMRIIGGSMARQAPPMRMDAIGSPIQTPAPDTSWLGAVMAGPIYENRFDVELEDQAETGTEREAELQQRLDLLGLVPDPMKGAMVADTLRATDWEGAEAMASKVEQVQQAMMAPQPREDVRTNISSTEMTPYEIGQILAKQDGITPDPSRQPGQPTATQTKAMAGQQPPPALDPNKALEVQGRVTVAAMKHGAVAHQGALDRTHEAIQAAEQRRLEGGLAALQADHQTNLARMAQQHPPAPPFGGDYS